MKWRQWLLAGVVAAAGCGTASVSNKDLAQLPTDARMQVIQAEQSVNIAQSNVGAAKVALSEAQKFRKVAGNEVDAAQSRLEAARNAVELGQSARDDRMLRQATANEQAARQDLMAAHAKLDYSDRLVDLRQAKLDEAQAAVNEAKANVESDKLQQLVRHGMGGHVDANAIAQRQQKAQQDLANARQRVAALEGDVQQLRTAWDDRRTEMNTASRDLQTIPAPPPPPKPLPGMRPNQGLPQGDVNDIPASPEVPLSEQPQGPVQNLP